MELDRDLYLSDGLAIARTSVDEGYLKNPIKIYHTTLKMGVIHSTPVNPWFGPTGLSNLVTIAKSGIALYSETNQAVGVASLLQTDSLDPQFSIDITDAELKELIGADTTALTAWKLTSESLTLTYQEGSVSIKVTISYQDSRLQIVISVKGKAGYEGLCCHQPTITVRLHSDVIDFPPVV